MTSSGFDGWHLDAMKLKMLKRSTTKNILRVQNSRDISAPHRWHEVSNERHLHLRGASSAGNPKAGDSEDCRCRHVQRICDTCMNR